MSSSVLEQRWRWPGGSRFAVRCWFPAVLAARLDPPPGDDPAAIAAWETACVREVRRGRPEAFNPLVAYYAPRIRAYLHRMVRHRQEAEDLTQETFLKAYRSLGRFDAGRSFRRWLYTIATNTGLNALRSRQRRGVAVELDPDALPQHGSVAPSAEKERLEAALAGLAPRARQLVTLHYHEGFTLAEAGAVLGIGEGAAKVALCRARRQLREMMLQETDDGL